MGRAGRMNSFNSIWFWLIALLLLPDLLFVVFTAPSWIAKKIAQRKAKVLELKLERILESKQNEAF
jgi:hypothetical protein